MTIVNLLFPPICRLCQEEGHWWCGESAGLWPVCLRCQRPSHPRHPMIIALGHYDGALREAIAIWKYHGQSAISEDWAARLAELLSTRITQRSVLVPIPLYWRKQLSRGYNQAEVLARQIARRLKVPVQPLLRRTRATKPQNSLKDEERFDNLRGSFSLRGSVPKTPIWLVDDIATSGATLQEAERTIRHAGGTIVGAIVVALAR